MLSALCDRLVGRNRSLVTVVRLTGVIGHGGRFRSGLSLASVAPLLERAFAPRRLTAVALAINSPGGAPVQAALIAGRIRQLAAEKQVPVLAFAEDVAASGGYWLACAADEIYADASSVIGSIGVISGGFGFTGFLQRLGVERRVYTAGSHKGMLDPFLPENPDDVIRLQAMQAEIHEDFKALVNQRRAGRLRAAADELFSGAFWTGRRAVELGLVDGLGDLHTVLRAHYGARVRVRAIEPPGRWPMARWLRPDASVAEGLDAAATGLIASATETALWSRYGL
ncbi:MAG: S49 family peptidase [Azospirillaceae bacterium]|nr:S49 family peptidase [Azospirillaceae bacterium]